MANFLARLISYVFHPLLMATYLFLLLAFTLPSALLPVPASRHLIFIGMLFVVTFALPVINLGIFKIFGTIKSYHMVERKERIIPFVLISVIYLIITWLFYSKSKMSLSDNFLKLMIIIDLLVIVATVVTLFFKVSVHSIAIWGIIGIVLPLNKVSEINSLFYPTIVLILIAGIVMSARLKLNAHNPREVMIGGALGLATSITGMLVLFTN
jgi:hypothetical protein